MVETHHHQHYGRVRLSREHQDTRARVLNDGRISVHLNEKAARLADQFNRKRRRSSRIGVERKKDKTRDKIDYNAVLGSYAGRPRLNIAIHIVGSRGDVQPFIPIGQILSKPPYSHRVRICTHPAFKDFVEENGLEFFSISGDPSLLMAYMVKNPGLMPGMDSLKSGDVGKRRADMANILEGAWRSCIEAGNGMIESEHAEKLSRSENASRLFIADAIIANPPSYAHLHCAERLRIPLHIMFTMPWSPTQAFPHPLATFERSNVNSSFANYISYTMMELLAWQGLGDVINRFRVKTLKLDPISPLWGHMLLSRMKVPFTYLWSQALIPRPKDWGPHISISGFSFLSLADSYRPSDDLTEFLNAGPPPVYIGFGSIVVDRPNELTNIIFEAVRRAGVRALVSKGWGGVGGNEAPEGVFLLGNCPHDWLFKRVSCVVHHGGAGTTAIGVALGVPTVIVPFFGDQPFWGAMVYRAGAGPEPIPFKKMTGETLANSIKTALGPEVSTAAKAMEAKISGEDPGASQAAMYFDKAADMDSLRCHLFPDRVAVWRVRKTNLRLSGLAAATLLNKNAIKIQQLKLVHHRDWYVDEGAENPLTGVVAAASGAFTNIIVNLKDYTKNMSKVIHRKEDSKSIGDSTPEDIDQLDEVPSRIQLRSADSYTSQYLEHTARSMAFNNFANKRKRATSWYRVSKAKSKKKEAHGALPNTQQQSEPRTSKGSYEHSRTYDAVIETEHFASSMISTSLRAPVQFFYHLSNGFNNAPSYFFNDSTVRRRKNISSFKSGCSVASKSLILGFYDGFTGLVTQPYHGAKKKGLLGFGKGIGKGVGGLIFKPTAGVVGVAGYMLKGVEKEADRGYRRDLEAKIIKVRIEQGIVEYAKADDVDKDAVLRRWKDLDCQI
ncbi:hypothetical protein B7494_g7975 [Chlorociboria aeruginascens]|nr:hypothetical protein B7494_g7975 [Chlorociboria aeruginascens]